MTPVFCCGFECGVVNGHGLSSPFDGWYLLNASFNSSLKRSGDRSLRVNPTSAAGYAEVLNMGGTNQKVLRVYFYVATPPDGNQMIACSFVSTNYGGLGYKSSDQKFYAAHVSGTTFTFGSTGISLSQNTWHRVDIRVDASANPWVIDCLVNGTDNLTVSPSIASALLTNIMMSYEGTTRTQDIYYDDLVVSHTGSDYPIGAGYVNHFVPTSDGTHNVAGAADFKRGAAGADIVNSTTDSYLLVDEVPLDDTTPDTNDYINAIAPPNATDYVENVFGPAPGVSTPTLGPRAVEVIVAFHQAGTGSGSSGFRLNDNGTEDTIIALNAAGVTTTRYRRKHYATMVGGGEWTAARFNNLKHRFGFVSDANPDQYFDCAMIEAEFAEQVKFLATPQQPYVHGFPNVMPV